MLNPNTPAYTDYSTILTTIAPNSFQSLKLNTISNQLLPIITTEQIQAMIEIQIRLKQFRSSLSQKLREILTAQITNRFDSNDHQNLSNFILNH